MKLQYQVNVSYNVRKTSGKKYI